MTKRLALNAPNVLFAMVLGCSGGDEGPAAPPVIQLATVTFTSAGISDTIDAQVASALIAEVRDAQNNARSGVSVQFSVIDPADGVSPAFQLLRDVNATPEQSLSVTSDANGRASAFVRLGRRVGSHAVGVSGAGVPRGDTLSVIVTAGQPANLVVKVRDTLITVGRSMEPGVQATDRANTSLPVTLATGAGTTACSVSSGSIHGNAIGRCTILVAAGSLVDSLSATVVPVGKLFGLVRDSVGGGQLVSFDFDGANYRTHASITPPSTVNAFGPVAVSPDRSLTAVFFGMGTLSTRITLVDANGAVRPFTPTGGPTLYENWPRFSQDGQWLYYSSQLSAAESFAVWRARPDGSGAERVTPAEPWAGVNSNYADITPDQRMVVYVDWLGRLRTMDRVTGIRRGLPNDATPAHAYTLRISPDGARLAYLVDELEDAIYVVNLDGSGHRLVTSALLGTYNDLSLDWTPDGQWLIAPAKTRTANEDGTTTHRFKEWTMVNVTTGALLPLPYRSGLVVISVAR